MTHMDVVVNIDPKLQGDRIVAISHTWDVPEGFRMSGPADHDGPLALIVDIELLHG